jgi:hypothetical protein
MLVKRLSLVLILQGPINLLQKTTGTKLQLTPIIIDI